MSIDDRWEVKPGDLQVFPPGQKPPKPDPHRLFTDEQYRGLIEQEKDAARQRLMAETLDRGGYEVLNEMIAETPSEP